MHTVSCLEKSFISTGYSNWKDAVSKFTKHQSSRCHQESVLKTVTLPSTTGNVGIMLCSQLATQRSEHRQCFLKVLSNVRFLARQGLALRGDGDESDSNFTSLLNLRSEDDSKLVEWVKQKTYKYTSAAMQNEMVKVMGLSVLRSISSNLQNTSFYTVMVDETTDVANTEQVVVCLRWVSECFEVREDFVSLYEVDSTEAEKIFAAIKDVFLRLNLAISKCVVSATTELLQSGVVKKMCDTELRAVYTHCYGHALNLACSDTIRQCKLVRDALDTTHEITKLVKKYPCRNATFKRLKEEMASDSPGIRILCPTRWTVRAQALKSITDNFSVLSEFWDESLEHVKDTEMKARIQGVAAQMKAFDFFFGVSLGFFILQHSDNLSHTMQRANISAAEGQEVVAMTLSTLASLRNESSFGMFWQRVCDSSKLLDVDKPALPRRRKLPRRLDDGSAPSFPVTVEEHYRVIYFEALDLITSCIKDHFNQPGFKVYGKVQALLLKAATCQPSEEELQFVLSFYKSDFDPLLLSTHLQIFSQTLKPDGEVSVTDLLFFQGCTTGQLALMSQVSKLVRLLLVMPATNAESERTFTAVRHIKTYLCSTMSQQRLNHLMLLHVHKSYTDDLSLVDVANDFIADNEHRKQFFGPEFKSS